MKKLIFLFFYSLSSFLAFAQSETIALRLEQPDKLLIDTIGTPLYKEDNTRFSITGGTPDYAILWLWNSRNELEGTTTYEVQVSDSNNCRSTIYINILEETASLEELPFNERAYPNPATNDLFVPLPSGEENVVLLLIDEDGKLLSKKIVENNGVYPLSLAHYPSGKYFVQIVAASKKITHVVIKN